MNRLFHSLNSAWPGSRVALTLAAGVLWTSLQAQQLPLLTVGTGSGEAGSEGNIPVTLAHGGAVTALQFEIGFPAAQLALIAVTPPPTATHEVVVSEVPADGTLRVVVYSSMNLPLPQGTLANLSFRISSRTPDGELALLPGGVIAGDSAGSEVKPVSMASGQIRVGAVVVVTPVLANVSRNAQGEVSFDIRGRTGAHYVIQASDALGGWSTLATRDAEADSIRFTDRAATAAEHRFYRVLVQ